MFLKLYFLGIVCFKIFLTFLYIFLEFANICQFPQNSGIHRNFLKIFESFFLKLFPLFGKIGPHIFTELSVPKFAWSLLLNSNTDFLKLFPYAVPHHPHSICHNGNQSVCEWRTPCLRHTTPVSIILRPTSCHSIWPPFTSDAFFGTLHFFDLVTYVAISKTFYVKIVYFYKTNTTHRECCDVTVAWNTIWSPTKSYASTATAGET